MTASASCKQPEKYGTGTVWLTVVACAEPKWVEPEVVKCAMSTDLSMRPLDSVGNVGEWRPGSIQDGDALAIFCHF